MSSGPYSAPWTDTGRLQGDIDRVNSELHRKADSHEVSLLHIDVAGLERTVGQLSSDLDELRRQLDQLRETFRGSLDVLGQMTNLL